MHIPISKRPNKNKILAIVMGLTMLATLLFPVAAIAAVSQPEAAARVSFTFDDGLASTLSQAAPALAAHGLKGTAYITTGCIGMTTTPNACPADGDVPYLSWEELTQLQNTYGWEIGGHSVTHPQLATDNLTDAQLAQEVAGSRQALVDHGFDPVSFATPYGDYDNRALAEIAKSYASHRGFWDVDNNLWPFNDYLINNVQVQEGVTVAQVKAKIDDAIANKRWIVLTFHDIRPNPSANPEDYQYATNKLNEIAAYVKSKQDANQLKNVNVKDGLVTSTTNLLTNGGFQNGLAGGWSTNNATSVVADSANHGSYPNSTNSVSMTATTSNISLFSPQVAVDSTKTYMLKSFVNVTQRTGGELGYYIDEYNAAGDWISGRWIKAQTNLFVGTENFTYTPSSANVKKASLQVYVTANSGIHAYVDTFQWFPLQEPETPPTQTNVLPNSNFDAGIGTGWSTDNGTAWRPDNTNQGSPANPVNSVKATAGTTTAHLFAPKVDVQDAVNYTIKAFLRILTLQSGEIGFYVDEYDAAGNWISGQYLGGQRGVGTGDLSFSYVPTSANVKKAGLQIILVGNSGISAYVDNVEWLVPTGTPPTPPDPTPVVTTVFEDNFATGFSKGWANDSPTDITTDNANNGASDEQQNSVKLTANATKNVHLFAPKVDVSSAKTYTINAFLNIVAFLTGEVAFYVDEYDVNGNWVSGKYLTGIRAAGTHNVNLSYTPSSANVTKASLQVIVTSNSGITAYLDSIKWTTTQ